MELGPPKRASRHSKLPSALALAALLLAGCVPQGPPPTVKTAPTLQAVSVAPGQLVQPLALTAFQLDFAPGKAVDYYQVGTSCQPLSATPNTSRSVDISGDQAQQLLLGFVADAFEDRGYRIDRSGKAGLTVTATWIAYTTDICKPYTSIGDSQTGHGRVWVQVRWVLAERSTGRVLLARETEGNGKVVSTIEKVSTELLRLALHQAAGNLCSEIEGQATGDHRFVVLRRLPRQLEFTGLDLAGRGMVANRRQQRPCSDLARADQLVDGE